MNSIIRTGTVLLILLLAPTAVAVAQQVDDRPPPPPRNLEEGTVPEPDITLIERSDGVIEEYRYAGKLYMVKITPTKGVPYYLVDSDGDGEFDSRRSFADGRLLLPRWVLYSW